MPTKNSCERTKRAFFKSTGMISPELRDSISIMSAVVGPLCFAVLLSNNMSVRRDTRNECLQLPAVKKFASVLYPNCLAPVEFVEYKKVDANV